MKLTKDQLSYIKWQIFQEKKELTDIFRQEYSEAEIFIIRGHDRFEDSRYNYRVVFSESEASVEKLLADTFLNGDGDEYDPRRLADRFYFITTTFRELDQGLTIDQETNKSLDDIDKEMLYFLLISYFKEYH